MLNSILGHHYVLLESCIAQTSVPLLKQLIQLHHVTSHICLVCLAYPPTLLVDGLSNPDNVHVLDCTSNVPGFTTKDTPTTRQQILSQWEIWSSLEGNITFVIDAAHVFLFDIQSVSETFMFLKDLNQRLTSRSAKLILHILKSSPILPLLIDSSFSPSLSYIKSHPSSLIAKIASEYLVSPFPDSNTKFWNIFIPISERDGDAERSTFSLSGPGCGDASEFVLEITTRNAGSGHHKRALERELHGWSYRHGGICDLQHIETLKITPKSQSIQSGEEAIHQTSFNLELTESQQKARASVPQPYAHEGQGTIYYDYDSADDHDEDDPDEDLDL